MGAKQAGIRWEAWLSINWLEPINAASYGSVSVALGLIEVRGSGVLTWAQKPMSKVHSEQGLVILGLKYRKALDLGPCPSKRGLNTIGST